MRPQASHVNRVAQSRASDQILRRSPTNGYWMVGSVEVLPKGLAEFVLRSLPIKVFLSVVLL